MEQSKNLSIAATAPSQTHMKTPDSLKPLFDSMEELKSARARCYADLLDTKQRAADAAVYRDGIRASADPDDIVAVRKLSEEAIRADLYSRKISDLERQLADHDQRCKSSIRPLITQIRQVIAVERDRHQSDSRAVTHAWEHGGGTAVKALAASLPAESAPPYHILESDLITLEEYLRHRPPFEVLEELCDAFDDCFGGAGARNKRPE